MSSITLKNITKAYGNAIVIQNLNLKINDKEFLVLVGPSGCGKSTILRMVAGLEDITDGELYIGDKLVNDVSPRDRNIAMVFQNYALYPHMTVYDNMSFGLKLRGFSKEQIKERVNYAAKMLGIEKLFDRKPKTLSGGQRQRIALGRAIVRNPKVFLLDEPLSNLDAKLRTQMRLELKKLHSKIKTTTIYVTHDQVEAMTLGDRIVVMNRGEILQVGTPMEVYDYPADTFVAGFIGNPPMNIIPCVLEKSGDKVFAKIEENLVKIEISSDELMNYIGKKVMLGIRPENIALKKSAEQNNAVVGMIEVLGSESILNVKVGSQEMKVRLYDSEETFTIGEKIEVIFGNGFTLFDADNGRAMCHIHAG